MLQLLLSLLILAGIAAFLAFLLELADRYLGRLRKQPYCHQ